MRKLFLALVAVAVAAVAPAVAGQIYISGHDSDDSGHVSLAFGSQLVSFVGTGNTNGGNGILVLGGNNSTSLANISAWNAAGPNLALTQVNGAAISMVNFSGYAGILMPSASTQVGGGITQADLNLINARAADIASFVNAGGNLMAFTQAGLTGAFGWFPLGPLTIQTANYLPVVQTPDLAAAGFIATNAELNGDLYHNTFTGPAGFFGLNVLATSNAGGSTQGQAAIIGGGAGTRIITAVPEPVSVAVFGGLLAVGGLVARRRMKAKA